MDPHASDDPGSSSDGGSTPDGPPSGAPGRSWTPPDAGVPRPAPVGDRGIRVEVEDADGPPVPPPLRRRRRRRRLAIGAAVLVAVGVPVGLVAAGILPGTETPAATSGDTDGGVADDGVGPDGGDDRDPSDGDGLAAPDLDALAGEDAVYGRLLIDIDASEQVMIAFQDEVAATFSGSAASPDELLETLQDTGAAARDELLEVRERLDDALDVDGAEEVRDRYVAHLDSWADYMDAVSDDPSVLSGEGSGVGFTVVINATADAFARALEEQLPDGADDAVRDYADHILDRGFRGSGDAQV